MHTRWLQKAALQEQREALAQDKQQLIGEIKKSHQEWIAAQAHFEFALDKDQIDYAIYALEAAEKRYEMLLKQAKQLQINLRDTAMQKEA
ncbi:DUF2508 family protein [Paenibacillus athensensis]|nr:DUF2508 family protein [Paenibacillus athensensis]